MDLTLLCDNTTITDRYFLGEPGISFLIRDGPTGVLFDLGYSDIFLRNAMAMGETLLEIERVVFSHAHLDHTWGLLPLLRHLNGAVIEGRPHTRPGYLAHPAIFRHISAAGLPEIGMPMGEDDLRRQGEVHLSREPVAITDDLHFLGEIPRRFSFEEGHTVGECDGRPDTVPDDTALAYASEDGVVVITGCAHAGICSTVEYAREVCGEERVAAVIGGFHLLDASEERINETYRYFRNLSPGRIYPCHCTGLPAIIALAGSCRVGEAGVGLSLSFAPRP
ncbi:MBL fold metallo-hydrolase [Methanofollis fontis]|uniref:MBL fold metallo-hydrolase n=1 Tax=Methanofollis fontis TaxID=2052832 RepID=A0A483CW07_9EURY|nr:MBL fold metallo-hydrolase [Methanofollis fontis]TAJ45711.1 MBL fold metallo-hydrolase [Methanofollis fontis]